APRIGQYFLHPFPQHIRDWEKSAELGSRNLRFQPRLKSEKIGLAIRAEMLSAITTIFRAGIRWNPGRHPLATGAGLYSFDRLGQPPHSIHHQGERSEEHVQATQIRTNHSSRRLSAEVHHRGGLRAIPQ